MYAEEEDIEETVSLSDLVINSNDDEHSGGDNTASSDDHHHHTTNERNEPADLFEFYKYQPDHHQNSAHHNQTFIFCGKIIHRKGHCEVQDGCSTTTFHVRSGGKQYRSGLSSARRPWRWYLFGFGAGMEQMKMRQMMRSTQISSPNKNRKPFDPVNGKHGIVRKTVNNKGFLGWFRGSLGCRDEFATAVVGCVPSS